ncbi:MAG TPA: TonB-dependent receptor [Gemmatimonadaceae bacterium]|nr:TonB-dependent receptor [Gemmatimonadaceae bacterium]
MSARAVLFLLLCAPALARAEPGCVARMGAGAVNEGRRWPSPLDRLVTLHNRDLALRDALDHLASAAHLRLSYSAELLTLDRRVCVSYDSVAAGSILSDLLDGSAVTPVVAGDDQVVLAPAAPALKADERAEDSVNVLERVVVTGSALGTQARGLATGMSVIDRTQLAHQSSGALSQMLNGSAAGVWLWDQSPSSLLAQYGSLRGASSFQVSYPKIYIDGIQVANPLLLTELSPDAVERIEVIRGPQGAALYGADAIGGVVNIIMRHDNGDEGDDGTQLRTSAGAAHSAYAAHPVLVQEHTLDLRGGSELKSSALSITLGSVGSYMPDAQSREARADGGFRVVGAQSVLTGTARLYAKEAGTGTSPLASAPSMPQLSESPTGHEPWPMNRATGSDISTSQSVREYTLGTTATFNASDGWTHALTAGLDGYSLSGSGSAALTPIPSAIDSALRAANGSANRATLRASSVARFGSGAGAAVKTTLAAEYSTLQQITTDDEPVNNYSSWESDAGIVGQFDGSWRNALFATGGLRIERTDGFAATNGLVSLPMLGGAAVHDFGPVTTKLRASYGKGIRPAGTALRAAWLARQSFTQRLAPEEQSGLEIGVDAFVGHSFAVHLTRFDQYAYNLIQPVAVASAMTPSPTDDGSMRLMYALQNLGEITNRGWELESAVFAGRLSLSGTLSFVDSRVRQVGIGYRGDLQAGDRMLGIPAITGGLTSTWTTRHWSASLSASRASDWINYDGLALSTASSTAGRPIVGQSLRSYWRNYGGVTRVDASASRLLFGDFTAVVTGRNLLDVQRGEPDNVTVVPGRTLTAGLQARF